MLYQKDAHRNQGVTFIELLVAIVLLAATIGGILSLFGATKRWIEASQSRMTVGELGKYVLDPLQMQVRADQWNANCVSDTVAAGAGCVPNNLNIQGRQFNIAYNVGVGPLPALRRVRIVINWNEPTF